MTYAPFLSPELTLNRKCRIVYKFRLANKRRCEVGPPVFRPKLSLQYFDCRLKTAIESRGQPSTYLQNLEKLILEKAYARLLADASHHRPSERKLCSLFTLTRVC